MENAIAVRRANQTIFVGKESIGACPTHRALPRAGWKGETQVMANGPGRICHLGGVCLFQRQGACHRGCCALWATTKSRPARRSAYRWDRPRHKTTSGGFIDAWTAAAPASSGRARHEGEKTMDSAWKKPRLTIRSRTGSIRTRSMPWPRWPASTNTAGNTDIEMDYAPKGRERGYRAPDLRPRMASRSG